jgi:hypothetical protein
MGAIYKNKRATPLEISTLFQQNPPRAKVIRRINKLRHFAKIFFFDLRLLVIYPLITVIFLVFNKPLLQLALPVRTLVLTIVLVDLMSYIIMPWLTKKLHKWLTD